MASRFTSRRAAIAITATTILTALLTGCGDETSPKGTSSPQPAKDSLSATPLPTATGSPTAESESAPSTDIDEPERLKIESINVDADIVGVGLNDDGSMQTPEYHTNTAGWYTEGPWPGAPGPAVIAAHVDGPNGTDVFADLEDITPGDEIVVIDVEGEQVVFVVERLATADKDELPYDEIWPDTDDTLLTLITCDGPYVDGEYEDNLIVYAEEA